MHLYQKRKRSSDYHTLKGCKLQIANDHLHGPSNIQHVIKDLFTSYMFFVILDFSNPITNGKYYPATSHICWTYARNNTLRDQYDVIPSVPVCPRTQCLH